MEPRAGDEAAHKRTITLIDDDVNALSTTRSVLEEAGYQVDSFSDPVKALEALQQNTPDLIICDIQMPTISGFELYTRARKNQTLKSVPFIFLSAESDTASIMKGRKIGVDDYITKPYKDEELLTIVEGRIKSTEVKKEAYIDLNLRDYKKEFAKIINHEIRTPLTVINICSELLMNQMVDNNELGEIREILKTSLKRLNSMINDISTILELAENQGRDRENVVKLDINSVIIQILEDMAKEIEEKQITPRLQLSKENPEISCVYNNIFQALKKIIENAVRFNKNGGFLHINTAIEHNKVIISIEDEGIGIKEEDQDKIFNLFTQINRTEFEQQGLGLGLTIASRYIEKNNGKISIKSKPGEGTIVYVTFDCLS